MLPDSYKIVTRHTIYTVVDKFKDQMYANLNFERPDPRPGEDASGSFRIREIGEGIIENGKIKKTRDGIPRQGQQMYFWRQGAQKATLTSVIIAIKKED